MNHFLYNSIWALVKPGMVISYDESFGAGQAWCGDVILHIWVRHHIIIDLIKRITENFDIRCKNQTKNVMESSDGKCSLSNYILLSNGT